MDPHDYDSKAEDGEVRVTDEDLQMAEAALLLSSLKYTKFDDETLVALHELKRKYLGGQEEEDNPSSSNCTRISNTLKDPTFSTSTAGNAARNLPANSQTLTSDEILRQINDYVPPEFPPVPALNGIIGDICSRPFEKQLTESDIRDGQSRLSLNKANSEKYLLPLLKKGDGDEDPIKGIDVTTYDVNGKAFKMHFKIWGNNKIHVLTGGWNAFKNEHQLRPHQDFVTVWMFRNTQTKKICFVISQRRLPLSEPVKNIKKMLPTDRQVPIIPRS